MVGSVSPSATAATTLHGDAANVEFFERGQDFDWESVFDPVLGDDEGDLRLHESTYLFHDRQLFSGQCFDEFVEVAIGCRRCLSCLVSLLSIATSVLLTLNGRTVAPIKGNCYADR